MKCKGIMDNLVDYDLSLESALERELQIYKCMFYLDRYKSCTV